jgi:predicted amidohydrolase YtcJ
MKRKKRLKDQGVVGSKTGAAAVREPRPTRDGMTTAFRSSEKAALFEELARSLADNAPSVSLPDKDVLSEDESSSETLRGELINLLADIGTGLWRLRLKMLPAGARHSSEENRRSYKQLEAILDTLTTAGVQIRDHTGEAVPRGGIYTLRVLAYEPTSGLAREQVIETIKPTIYLKNRVIQIGEVIIGTPETLGS